MAFNSLTFLFFITLFFCFYFFLEGKRKIFYILFASYIFYAFWDWRFLALILLSTSVDYLVGFKISIEKSILIRRYLLLISILTNLIILGIFKYLGFFVDSFESFFTGMGLSPDWPTLNIILPVGISFYTFQSMSYTIDIYRNKLNAEKDFFIFASYASLFPQLVAGPIVRAVNLLPQLRKPKLLNNERLLRGVEFIVWGYFLKVVLADNVGFVIDTNGYFEKPQEFNSFALMLGTFLFSFQIYGDFAGYSLIAIGISKIMGFDLSPNFNRPYFSKNFSEFWKRWHISLSSWLRDYLYISLGGNRKSSIRTYINLLLTMIIGGLWHGASWTFIMWGFIHGSYLVIFRFFENFLSFNQHQIIKFFQKCSLIFIVFVLTNIAWIFFRSNNLSDSFLILKKILLFDMDNAIGVLMSPILVKALLALIIVLIFDLCCEITSIYKFYERSLISRIGGIIFSLWLIIALGNFSGNEFVYFQF